MPHMTYVEHMAQQVSDRNGNMFIVPLGEDIIVDDRTEDLEYADCIDDTGQILDKYWYWHMPLAVLYDEDDDTDIIISHHSISLRNNADNVYSSFIQVADHPYTSYDNVYLYMPGTGVIMDATPTGANILVLPEIFYESYNDINIGGFDDEDFIDSIGLDTEVSVVIRGGNVIILRPQIAVLKLYVLMNNYTSEVYGLTTQETDIPITLTFGTLKYKATTSLDDLYRQLIQYRVPSVKYIHNFSDVLIL